jgi:hypothetical protein
MTGFKRAVGLGLLVSGTLGLWGCNAQKSSEDTRGFQDPVQMQHREHATPAGRPAGSGLLDTSSERGSQADYGDSLGGETRGGTAAPHGQEEATGGSGQTTPGDMNLGTGLADSYRSPHSGTGGAGDAGVTPDAGPHHR